MLFPETHSQITDCRPDQALVVSRGEDEIQSSISLDPVSPWHEYLDGLARAHRVTFAHVQAVKVLFRTISQAVHGWGPLGLPLTQPVPEGALQVSWDTGTLYLEI